MSGSITFRCAGREFDVADGAFVYLPKGIMHGYTVKHDGPVRLLAITFPTYASPGEGWGGFIADIEKEGTLIAVPANKR